MGTLGWYDVAGADLSCARTSSAGSLLHPSRAMGSLQIASLVQELQRECVGGALAVLQGPPVSIWPL